MDSDVPKPTRTVADVDPITLEIIRGKLLAIADEMGIALARSSMSPVIYEVLDFACGICDTDAQLIAQTNGITLFTGTFAGQVDFIRRKFKGSMRPGDIYMTNDPYEGGTHTPDIALIKPIFVEDTLLGFAISVAHWSEVGGSVAGSIAPDAREIFQEGVRFPGIRIYREGKLQEDIEELIRANVRLPKMSLGDLNAGLAAVRIADTRLQELAEKYGEVTLRACFERTLEMGERMSRAAVAALPDGVYEAEDWIDGDGIVSDQIPVRVKVIVEGDRITFDFGGCAEQRPGPINCAHGALLSSVKTVFKALVDPQAPSNEGYFRPITVIAPDGMVFTARQPAPTGWYYEGAAQASELVWKALAPLAPHRFSAGSYMSLCASYVCGKDPQTGEIFVHIEPHVGGWGATDTNDGASALIATTDGDTYNYSIELLEAKFPLRCTRYALNVADGAGCGRYRGGFGVVRKYEILTDEAFTYASIGRSIERPWGLADGGPGSPNYMEIESKGKVRRMARVPHVSLRCGDRVCIVTGGGGGYGKPFERSVEEVLADVRNDYITPEVARERYGVVLGPGGEVDKEATQALRSDRGGA
jgi:N-methylhydantoinase B